MIMNFRNKILAGGAAATMSFAAMGGLADAQVDQEGLVNVAVTDVTVQVPIGVAANVCGVAVNVLAQATNTGDVECTADGVAIAESENGNGGPVTQRGLVNLAITDTTVQVPVSVAANVCGVAVNVLAEAGNFGDVDCTADAESIAS
jgi:hypothetical protein